MHIVKKRFDQSQAIYRFESANELENWANSRVNGRTSFDRGVRERLVLNRIRSSVCLLTDRITVPVACFFITLHRKKPIRNVSLFVWSMYCSYWCHFPTSAYQHQESCEVLSSRLSLFRDGIRNKSEHRILPGQICVFFENESFWWCEPSKTMIISLSKDYNSITHIDTPWASSGVWTRSSRFVSYPLNGRGSTDDRSYAIEKRCSPCDSDHSPSFLQCKHPITWCIRYRLPCCWWVKMQSSVTCR